MNAFEFTAPAKEAQAVLVVKRSKFIGNVSPAFSQKKLKNTLRRLRRFINKPAIMYLLIPSAWAVWPKKPAMMVNPEGLQVIP